MTPLDLETELRESRPEPTPVFAAELDAWATEGFPKPEQPRRRPEQRRRRWVLPAIGAAATAALVIGVVLSQRPNDVELQHSRPEAGGPGTSVPVPSGEAESGADIRPVPKRPAPRVQEKSASIALSAPPGDVADVAQDATDVTERYGGIVDEMSVRTDGGASTARLALRIPTENLGAALAELSDLATVESRDEALLDITRSYTAAGKTFNGAQDRVNELVAALAATDDPAEIAGLRARLRVARERLRAAAAQLRDQKQRGNLARVRLSVVSPGDP